MLNSFTETARRLIREAHEEAHRRRHRSVGPEHLVVAMMRQREGMALAVLHRLGLQRAAVTEDLEGALARVGAAARPATEIPFSPEAARALERSIQQARYLESNWVGTEHLLLGLLYDEHSLRPAAAQVTDQMAKTRFWRFWRVPGGGVERLDHNCILAGLDHETWGSGEHANLLRPELVTR